MGEQLTKGSSKNKIGWITINGEEYEINGDGQYDFGNYKINVKEGTLRYK